MSYVGNNGESHGETQTFFADSVDGLPEPTIDTSELTEYGFFNELSEGWNEFSENHIGNKEEIHARMGQRAKKYGEQDLKTYTKDFAKGFMEHPGTQVLGMVPRGRFNPNSLKEMIVSYTI